MRIHLLRSCLEPSTRAAIRASALGNNRILCEVSLLTKHFLIIGPNLGLWGTVLRGKGLPLGALRVPQAHPTSVLITQGWTVHLLVCLPHYAPQGLIIVFCTW